MTRPGNRLWLHIVSIESNVTMTEHGLQWKPFWPNEVRPTNCSKGDCEVNQQYSPGYSFIQKEERTRMKNNKLCQKEISALHWWSRNGHEDTMSTFLSPRFTLQIELHQPYPNMPSTTRNYQVFFCCTKTTGCLYSLVPSPLLHLVPDPACFNSLNSPSISDMAARAHTVFFLDNADCDTAIWLHHSQCYSFML